MSFLRHDLDGPLATHRGAVVAIGNFDGVHRGHQAVLSQALEIARERGLPALVLSFEPHPRTLFKPEAPVFRLTPPPLKGRVLEAMGFDGLVTLPFTREVAATGAADFVKTFLVERLGAAHVLTGYDFHFGSRRSGTPDTMREAGREHGFGVSIVERFADDEDAVSSSRVRRLLGSGDVTGAAALLGYRWMIAGSVVPGARLGRTLGYPTANIVPGADNRMAHGVYAVRLRVGGTVHDGVASWGRRPTFDNGPPWLETFVFDFDDDIYGEWIEVSMFERLRGEEKFDSADALVEQMRRDESRAREILARAEPLSALDRTLNFA